MSKYVGLFSTSLEQHAFLIGLFETMCPWWARYRITKKAEFGVKKEYHYYVGGRAAGVPLLLLELIGIVKLIEVLF